MSVMWIPLATVRDALYRIEARTSATGDLVASFSELNESVPPSGEAMPATESAES